MPLNVWDYERLAEERLEPGAHGYYAGGAGDELTLRDNVEAFRRRNVFVRRSMRANSGRTLSSVNPSARCGVMRRTTAGTPGAADGTPKVAVY